MADTDDIDSPMRQKHVKYGALSRDPKYQIKYPKKKFYEFKRWWDAADPADRQKFDRELEKDYEDHRKEAVAKARPIIQQYLQPDSDIQSQIRTSHDR